MKKAVAKIVCIWTEILADATIYYIVLYIPRVYEYLLLVLEMGGQAYLTVKL